MALSVKRDSFKRLLEIAQEQQGFFTAKQAKEAGFVEQHHAHHVEVGNWVKEYRGIYRLPYLAQDEWSELMLWSLWSRNREDVPQGVFSHQTALAIYDLSDLMPAKIHMTVPRRFRRNSEIPKALVLHHADLPQNSVRVSHGVGVTPPLFTIGDLLREQSVAPDILRQAMAEGLQRGLITRHDLDRVPLDEKTKEAVEALYQEAIR